MLELDFPAHCWQIPKMCSLPAGIFEPVVDLWTNFQYQYSAGLPFQSHHDSGLVSINVYYNIQNTVHQKTQILAMGKHLRATFITLIKLFTAQPG